MNVRTTAAALASCMLALPAAAHAHWQNTRWGMTADELQAVRPGVVEKRVPSGGYYLSGGPMMFAGLMWSEVTYTFDTRGKLREVRLTGSHPYQDIRDRLVAQLGPPASEKHSTPLTLTIHDAIFRDTEKANSVTLYSMAGGNSTTTILTYREIESAF